MKIKSKNIVLKDEVIQGTLSIENGIIQSIDSYEKHSDAKDYGELIVAPGLIDIHNHGYAGWSFTGSSSKEDIDKLRRRMLLEGVTSMLATSSFLGIENIIKSTENNGLDPITSILGIHIEGPFLNSEQHGAAPPDTEFPLPDLKYMKDIWQGSGDFLKMVTIAPEITGSEEIISFLKDKEVKIAAGHTNVTYGQLEQLNSKIDSMTHLGNAMSGIHHREIGALGYGLLNPDVWVELIADGIHLSKPMLDLVFSSKSVERILLISDTVPLAGLNKGNYLTTSGQVFVESDGKVVNEFGNINGSSSTLLNNIRYLRKNHDISLVDLFKMGSLNQVEFLGFENIGQIKEMHRADLLVLDDDLNLIEIYKDGESVDYNNQTKENNLEIDAHLKDKEFFNFYSLRS